MNSGPPVPQTGALTGLRYAPMEAGVYAAAREGFKSRRPGRRDGGDGADSRRPAAQVGARGGHQAPQHADDQEIVRTGECAQLSMMALSAAVAAKAA